jgi:HEPN domain-containing protein
MAKKKKPATGARKHTQIENIEVFGAKAGLSPLGLIIYADHYLHAARTAQPSPNSGEFHPACLFLVCRSLELALKAFLSLRGRSLDELAGGAFGHDLDKLLAEADKQDLGGLVKLSEEQRFQIGRASVYYAEKVCEYPSVLEAMKAYPSRASMDRLLDAAETLIPPLREPCLHAE